MRFTALDLRSYGPFQHAPVLDLSGGERGLHLIVGPNEAGKSTALRAIRALLFDFPHSTPDNHGRDLATLRVGATLRNEAGEELAFLRRKRGTKLWTGDDRTALPADALTPFLGGLDEATFVDLFSTDHAELVQGGQAIIRGGGRLGEMLFAAGSGLAQLDRVREALQKEIDGLFKARNATVPTINKALVDLKAAREVVRSVALPTNDWVDANNKLHHATAARADVSRRQREAQGELDRWRSWLGALRIIPRRQEVIDQLAAQGSTNTLRPDFAEAYQADSEASRLAGRTSAEARDALALAAAELAKLGPADPALLEADAIGRLHADLGRYSGARRERPTLAAKLARSEEQVAAIRAEIPGAASLPAGGLTVLRDAIQTLAQDHAGLLARKGEAEAELARFDPGELDPAADGAISAELRRWVASLEAALVRITALGDLEALRLKAQSQLAKAEAEAATSLRGLSLWSGTLEALVALAIPPDATFARFDDEIRAADERVRAAEAERTRLASERLDLDRDDALAQVQGAIPTEADLATHRTRRDAFWKSIRRGWVDREPLAPSPARLADDFEAEAHQADAVADALRWAADRVAAAAQRDVERRNLLDQIALKTQTRDEAVAARAAALAAWAEHWRPLGIEPTSPREMKDWVRVDRKERLRCGKNVRDARAEVDRITAQVDALRDELGHALARVGEPPLAEGESLAAILARGRAVVARIGARVQRAAARARLAEVLAHEATWLDRWAAAVAPLGLPPDAAISTARGVVDQLAAWADATREAKATRDLLADLDAIERRFATEAAALAGRLDPALAENSGDDWQPVAAALVDRHAGAVEARTRRSGWLARLDEERTRLAGSQAALARSTVALTALVAEAGVASADDLPAAIRRSAAVEAARADLSQLDKQLDDYAGAMTRAALLAAVAGSDERTLAARIAEAGETLATLESESHRLGEEIGAAKQQLDAMNRGPGAADAEQNVHDQAARLGVDVERYARLKLAAAVLRDAVERHRARNQGPVLDRAGALFARLTAGSFAGLQTDLDDKNEPILRGVRGTAPPAPGADLAAPGPLVDVAQMSEGTADQLYLALRLASLAVHLDDPDHTPAPLVADDILINFDDGRALAALAALADLSRRTQVLFFTHHDHLAEIARAHLPADLVFVHRLIPVGTEPASPDPATAPQAKRKRSPSPTLADL